MTRAMNTLILTRAHYRRRYGADMPVKPASLRASLKRFPRSWSKISGAAAQRGPRPLTRPPMALPAGTAAQAAPDGAHFNYEDESQEIPHAAAASSSSSRQSSTPKHQSAGAPRDKSARTPEAPQPNSIDNIARFFGGKSGAPTDRFSSAGLKSGAGRPGSFARPAMEIPKSNGASGLKKGQRVMHSKYGEGTVLLREGDGEDAKLTVLFQRHGMKKLMEKFANLRRI